MLAGSIENGDDKDRPQDGPSLDKATKLPKLDKATKLPKLATDQGAVWVTIYPGCGEATLTPVLRRRQPNKGRNVRSDPERCRAEAARRARTMVRRFCAEYRLIYMWTLTYRGDGEHDIEQVRRHVERLVAKIVQDRNGRRFPYVAVPELHATDHGIHVHMAVPFFYKHAKLMKIWGRGFVWCSAFHQKGECSFAGSRRAAKYLGKAYDEHTFGKHRYWRAQRFPVERFTFRQRDFDDGEEVAVAVFHWLPYDVWWGKINDFLPVGVLTFPGRVPEDD